MATRERDTFRIKYTERSLERLESALAVPEVRRSLGEVAMTEIDEVLRRYFVPNLISSHGGLVRLETPKEYRNGSALPVMAGYPAERLLPDAAMTVQTDEQRTNSTTLLEAAGADQEVAEAMVGYFNDRAQHRRRQDVYIARYANFASVHGADQKVTLAGELGFITTRPFTLLVIGEPESPFAQLAPSSLAHETRHVADHLATPVLAYGQAWQDFTVSTEMRGHHTGKYMQDALAASGNLELDDYGHYNLDDMRDMLSTDEQFERIRSKLADPARPFAPNQAVYEELFSHGLIPAPHRYTYRGSHSWH